MVTVSLARLVLMKPFGQKSQRHVIPTLNSLIEV